MPRFAPLSAYPPCDCGNPEHDNATGTTYDHAKWMLEDVALDMAEDRMRGEAAGKAQAQAFLAATRPAFRAIAEKLVVASNPIPNGLLTQKKAAARLAMSLTEFKDSGAATEIPSRQIGKGTQRKHKVYEEKDVDAWGRAHKAGGNFDSQKGTVARLTSSGSGTTDDASKRARVAQIETRLRSKRRGFTRT